ncbi:uncharacterized protein LOC106086205 [Stomoxys calcitrans]|uniref:uncharacterized protein LOC106086205 n=1 Tax=Stomoxys calcitrans TaxID=35570 RepID=UPI0027E35C00|nr:uncharacterized protein LOC106086205 [Stomoxys calcitrans]
MNCGYMYEVRRKTDDIDEELRQRNENLKRHISEEEEDDTDVWEVPQESFDNAYEQVINEMEFNETINDKAKNDIGFTVVSHKGEESKELSGCPPQKIHLSLSAEQISLKLLPQQNLEHFKKSIKQQTINKSINTETDIKRPVTVVNTASETSICATALNCSGSSGSLTTTTTTTTNSSVKWKNVKINKEKPDCEHERNKKPFALGIISINNLVEPQKSSKTIEIHNNEILLAKASEIKLSSLKPATTTTLAPTEGSGSTGAKSFNKILNTRRKFSLGSSSFRFKKPADMNELPKCWPVPNYEITLNDILSPAISEHSFSSSAGILTYENPINVSDKSTNPFRFEDGNAKSILLERREQRNPSILVTQASSSSSLTLKRASIKSTSLETFDTASSVSSTKSIHQHNEAENKNYISTMPVIPSSLTCEICYEILKDPRCLNCLHTFCLECLVEESFRQDGNNPFVPSALYPTIDEEQQYTKSSQSEQNLKVYDSSQTRKYSLSPEPKSESKNSELLSGGKATAQKRPSLSFKLKRLPDNSPSMLKTDLENISSETSVSANQTYSSAANLYRILVCKTCQFVTEIPMGGIRQLPPNLLVTRKINEYRLMMTDEFSDSCSLCYEETYATHFCDICKLKLCTLCKEAHERQKSTANHNLQKTTDFTTNQFHTQTSIRDNNNLKMKCSLHVGFEIKSFCHNCLQVACADCLVLQHKGHRVETIDKAIKHYTTILKDSTEQTRLICKSAEHSLEKLNASSLSINRKCDELQTEVEQFIEKYAEAVEVHRKTLLQQVQRSRETKVHVIGEQQEELDKHTQAGQMAITFSQELMDVASDEEILSFFKILLKRFEYCQKMKTPIDPKIINTPNFLPKIQAPLSKDSHDIPMFGIITMQIVEPSLCTLQWDGFSQLRLNKKVELTLISRDADGIPMCHGGLKIQTHVKYKDLNSKCLRMEVTDNSDGTYGIAFTPDSEGTILLMITINEKHIKGSPFSFLARSVRPHTGVYHCCTFCSSKGNKFATCSCEGNMPGYSGCGHGHSGHPGRRHWSCCGEVSRNSECYFANRSLNPK